MIDRAAIAWTILVIADTPQEFDEKSVFNGKVYTDHSQAYSKAANARAHGARGVIIVSDRLNHASDPDLLEPFGRTEGPSEAPIPMVQVKEDVANAWLGGNTLRELERSIDADLKPRSFALPKVRLRERVDIERAVKTVTNVLAYLPGRTDEYLIIGAHYDHLGLGEHFSMAPSLAGTVHPGADDNASGTAGVLELARHFASQPKPERGILFMTFAGEELGLLGSGYYANHPVLPLEKAAAMINLDMIGRLREGKLYVGGAGTGTGLREILDTSAAQYHFKMDYSDNGYGSSDHTSFTTKQVPVLFFFSGLHGDYHKPSDTWDKIDTSGALEVLSLVAEVASRIDGAPAKPRFIRVEPKVSAHAGDSAAPSGSSGGGYGPNFGSIPDFAEPPKGVRFADVKEGSPAALAGLKPGDILVTFGDRDIANLYDFTYALRAHKAGDEVLVEVLRGNQKVAVRVKLTERK
jgi:Zn-dependent M28 family amino/carboxypeptidase